MRKPYYLKCRKGWYLKSKKRHGKITQVRLGDTRAEADAVFRRMQLIEREELNADRRSVSSVPLWAKDRVAAGDLVKSTYDGWRRYVRVLFSDNKDCFVERLRVIDVMEWLTQQTELGTNEPKARRRDHPPSAQLGVGIWGHQIQSASDDAAGTLAGPQVHHRSRIARSVGAVLRC